MSLAVVGAAAGILATVIAVTGFVWSPHDFGLNFLSEVAGLSAGVALAVLVVDRLQAEERAMRWARVKEQTAEGLRSELRGLARPFYTRSPAISEPHVALSGEPHSVMAELDELKARLFEDWERLAHGERPESMVSDPASITCFRAAAPFLSRVSETFIPRMLQVGGGQPELLKALLDVESVGFAWRTNADFAEVFADDGEPNPMAWGTAVGTLSAAAEAWRVLASD
jgi:hypothetical protein